ncbi:PEP-CTERM sorting domain-containing protein [Pseudorhodoferax sp.]|uniref:PEP-CTERM sorting domain-containing protein n=1 Tax=Pseudorhodoferax sp. TaxID=1993553 RepID=UPI002DD62B76|nr:PEP-CTERM sorting domain-containing protein [Pseudorhodoferax sp.]
MHSILRGVLAGTALALCTSFASAAVLSFDDIAGPDGYETVPTNYGGVDWSSAGWSVLTFDEPSYPARSGAGRVTTGFGSDDAASVIRFLAPTVFNGAWFSGFGDVSVRFDLFAGGLLVASSETLMLSGTPTYLDAGWGGAIDAITVSSNGHALFGMDDFSFEDVSEVPEPATLALVLAGLGMAGIARRRRA